MRIGIFGGAFNPVHNGHINLAENYLNAMALDKVIFIPTYKPPHKSDNELVSGQDRINMLSLALTDKRFEISTIEFEREQKSYTYDTLKELKKLYPDDSLYLIIGSDQFLSFDKWYRYKDILEMATLCSFPRENNDNERLEMLRYSKQLGAEDSIILDKPVYKVSSSEIREKIRQEQDISGLVPDAVEKYITEKGLYIV